MKGLIISIDGNENIPAKLSKCRFEKYDLDVESYRDVNTGTLVRNFLTNKVKLFLEVPYIKHSELLPLIKMLDKRKFTVVYKDLVTGANRTGVFYCGDFSLDPYQIYTNGDIMLNPFTINLIEY